MNDGPVMANEVGFASETTVLVVDDQVMVRAMLSDGLRDLGYKVIEAASADEAIVVLHSDIRVDLVLTDMQMPGTMDGSGLVRLIRQTYPFMKVVMVAGQRPEDATIAALDGYLAKPVTPSQLGTYVQSILSRSSLRDTR